MIAPIKGPEPRASSPGIRRARSLVASTLLKRQPRPIQDAAPVPVWQAWLFAGWVVVVVAAYFASMAGFL